MRIVYDLQLRLDSVPMEEIEVSVRETISSQALYTQYLQRIAQQKTGLSYGYKKTLV